MFDRDAKRDGTLSDTSPSERACALSHLMAWEGVRDSLLLSSCVPECSHPSQPLSSPLIGPSLVPRLFRIAGFAHGPPLMSANELMPPAPVCVLMEDDAILADRFADRLAALLEELPRDFHFCSLGYSRPKMAPMVPYSSQLGVPSFLWYLTGCKLLPFGLLHRHVPSDVHCYLFIDHNIMSVYAFTLLLPLLLPSPFPHLPQYIPSS